MLDKPLELGCVWARLNKPFVLAHGVLWEPSGRPNLEGAGLEHLQPLDTLQDLTGAEQGLPGDASMQTRCEIHGHLFGQETRWNAERYPRVQIPVKANATVPVMRSSNKKPKSNTRSVATSRSADSLAQGKDADTAQLRQIATVMGNDHIKDSLKGSASQRDAMLAHICARLGVLEGAQDKERQAMGSEREWFKGVAKGVEGYHNPDLSRWHESAKLYQRAGAAMCNGQLGRGAQLLEQAASAERAAFESVPKFVEADLEAHQHAVAAPEVAMAANDEAACAGCAKPADLKIADKILALQDKVEAVSPIPRVRRAWFEEEQDVDEEDENEA